MYNTGVWGMLTIYVYVYMYIVYIYNFLNAQSQKHITKESKGDENNK